MYSRKAVIRENGLALLIGVLDWLMANHHPDIVDQRTLILVKSKDLAEQWRESIRQFTGLDAGQIGGGVIPPKNNRSQK